MTAKVYVDVLAVFSREGELIPTAFVWEDGRKYAIDKVSKLFIYLLNVAILSLLLCLLSVQGQFAQSAHEVLQKQ